MPRPVEGRGRYIPALDGVRALAVALVIGYHLGVPGLGGGLLGVGVFLTLSGFLVTGLLLTTWHRTGRLALGRFYVRRARRIVPALVVVLVVVLLTVLLVDREEVGPTASRALGAALFVGNWQQIASVDPSAGVATAGPLDHLWPLAVGAQVYLVWPVLLLVLAALPWVTLRFAAWVAGGLATWSFVLGWTHAGAGLESTRAYVGTDTRAGALLVGAVLAVLMWQPTGRPRFPETIDARVDRWALLGLTVIGVLAVFTDAGSPFLYHGGMVLLALGTAAVIAVVVHPRSRVGRVLGCRPLAWVGERSYGIYLWHLPVVVFAPAGLLEAQPVLRDAVLVAVTVVLATLSWALVENPIRRLGLREVLRRGRIAPDGGRRAVPAIAAATGAMVIVATSALSAQALVGGPAALATATPVAASPVDRPQEEEPPEESGPPRQVLPPGGVDCAVAKCIALTFDDGPVTGTADLLDVLRSRGAHATFFVVGRNAERRPDLLRRMVEEGHVVGNHSVTHADLTRLGAKALRRELTETNRAIEKATGTAPTLMRPPFGATDRRVAKAARTLGMAQVLWDLDPRDWEDRHRRVVRDRVLAGAHPGAIVISHDTQEETRAAYAEIVDHLIAEGYLLVTVPELLGGPGKPGKAYTQG